MKVTYVETGEPTHTVALDETALVAYLNEGTGERFSSLAEARAAIPDELAFEVKCFPEDGDQAGRALARVEIAS